MNAKQRRAARRHPVERGYGPRHAFNAQEGEEAVPSPLPSPPYEKEGWYGKTLRDVAGLDDEALEEIKKNPMGMKALATYANLGIMLMPGMGGEKPGRVPKVTAAKEGWEPNPHQMGSAWNKNKDPKLMSPEEKAYHEAVAAGKDPGAEIVPHDDSADFPDAPSKQDIIDMIEGAVGEGKDIMDFPPPKKPPIPPEELKKGTKGVRKNPKHVGHPPKIGVEKGFGPRHSANSKEGEDLTAVDTDTVPAMLTPREAVLNRNAAEMAGRGKIEQLNEAGNEMARRGIDLAGGETMQSKPKHLAGGDDAVQRNPFPNRGPGGVYPSMPGLGGGAPPDQIGGFGGGLGARDEFGRQFSERNEFGGFGRGNGVPPYGSIAPPGTQAPPGPGGFSKGPLPAEGWQPMPAIPPQQWRSMPSSPFYPPGQGLKMAQGEEDILGNPGSIYGSAAPVSLSSPGGLGDLVKAITAEGQKQGLNANQIAGILKMVQGMGGTGGGSGLTVGAGTGNMDAVGAFQGGISEVGYAPGISPRADFSYDRGGWVGAYDPRYSFPSY